MSAHPLFKGIGRRWTRHDRLRWLLCLTNPLREPSLFVALLFTGLLEVGQEASWALLLLIAFSNWLALRLLIFLLTEVVCLCFSHPLPIPKGRRRNSPEGRPYDKAL